MTALSPERIAEIESDPIVEVLNRLYESAFRSGAFGGMEPDSCDAYTAYVAIRDLLAERDAGWQLIETAPKDKTPVDIWLASGKRVPDLHWWPTGNCWTNDGTTNPIIVTPEQATHWRHVPEPPSDG